jgi:hypothetical protein
MKVIAYAHAYDSTPQEPSSRISPQSYESHYPEGKVINAMKNP